MINLGDGVEHPLNLSFNYRSFSLVTIINYRFKRQTTNFGRQTTNLDDNRYNRDDKRQTTKILICIRGIRQTTYSNDKREKYIYRLSIVSLIVDLLRMTPIFLNLPKKLF